MVIDWQHGVVGRCLIAGQFRMLVVGLQEEPLVDVVATVDSQLENKQMRRLLEHMDC